MNRSNAAPHPGVGLQADAEVANFPVGHCEVRREPLSAYLASRDFVSSSQLRRFGKLGLVASQLPDGGNVTGTGLGEALHSLILEPDVFASQYSVLSDTVPSDAAKSQIGVAEEDLMQPQWLDAWQWSALHHTRDAVMACTEFPLAEWLSRGEKELSIYWSDKAGNRWKARPDCFLPDIVLDLKSTSDSRSQGFKRTRERLDYDLQAAHYVDAVSQLGGETLRFAFIVVELKAPYAVRVHELSTSALARALERLAELKSRYISSARTAQVNEELTQSPDPV